MQVFGIIGNPLEHSFSPSFFAEKFRRESIDAVYKSFTLNDVDEFPALCASESLAGLNVTYPYKESIIPYLDELDETAKAIGAVNVIKFTPAGKRIGYNTDIIGFKESLSLYQLSTINYQQSPLRALILGTGGAAKAVAYALKQLNIAFQYVSRDPSKGLVYSDLTAETIAAHQLIINCTPLGMFPQIDAYPPIPYEALSAEHFLYDLIYNPAESSFLRLGKKQGAKIQNGLRMLQIQAEAAWNIWTKM